MIATETRLIFQTCTGATAQTRAHCYEGPFMSIKHMGMEFHVCRRASPVVRRPSENSTKCFGGKQFSAKLFRQTYPQYNSLLRTLNIH